jgi:hypothetical protein
MSRPSSTPAAAALPFLSCDANGKFHLEKAAVSLLNGLKGRICPVVVCGPYRTGSAGTYAAVSQRVCHLGARPFTHFIQITVL